MKCDAFAERVREGIRLEGIQQAQLAKRIGKAPDWLSKRMTGSITVSLKDAELVSVALKVSPGWLAFGEGLPRPDDNPARRNLNGAFEAAVKGQALYSALSEGEVDDYWLTKPASRILNEVIGETLRGIRLHAVSKGALSRTTMFANGAPALWAEDAPREQRFASPGNFPDTVFIPR